MRLLSLVVKKTEQMQKIKLRPLVVLYLAKNIEFSHNKVMHGDMRKCKRYFVIRTIQYCLEPSPASSHDGEGGRESEKNWGAKPPFYDA